MQSSFLEVHGQKIAYLRIEHLYVFLDEHKAIRF